VRQGEGRRGQNKHIIGLKGRVGLVESYSGDVPVYERFYAGGFSTLRGSPKGSSATQPS
jgi:outer membrane protein assembly factor BamA